LSTAGSSASVRPRTRPESSRTMNAMPPPPPVAAQTTTPVAQGLSIASLVLGCVGIFLFWLYAIVPVLAIIFGGVAINKQKKAGVKPSGMAIAGLVLGIVFTAIMVLALLAVVAT